MGNCRTRGPRQSGDSVGVLDKSPSEFGSSNPSPTKQTASASPEIVIDLNVWADKGDIRIRGWADGSAGVGGYPEHRETVLHL